MKIGDHVYVITNRLQTGAGIPGIISAVQDSMVEVMVDFAYGPRILKVSNWEDLLPSNLYTHSISQPRLSDLWGDRAKGMARSSI
jgi:hypothetical protein